ncbi:putative yippee-like protein Os10g0369500 isoform X2 [Carex rostrata]
MMRSSPRTSVGDMVLPTLSAVWEDFVGMKRCGVTLCCGAYQHQLVCVNFTVGPSEDRHLLTGWHIVCDVYCSCCQQLLGWKYEKAYDESQKYKEGRFVLEKARVMKAVDLSFL